MANSTQNVVELFKGQFLETPEKIAEKFAGIKAFVFDWDGVFNNGVKNENGSSTFNEIDAMGTNMLRFNYYMRSSQLPITAIITGENNIDAQKLALREHYDALYYGIKTKQEALKHLCKTHFLRPNEVVFFFDDILDLAVAELVGLRVMINRECNPLLLEYVKNNKLADYITSATSGNFPVREAIELFIGLTGMYNETIRERINNSELYKKYLMNRNLNNTAIYTNQNIIITQQ